MPMEKERGKKTGTEGMRSTHENTKQKEVIRQFVESVYLEKKKAPACARSTQKRKE